MIWPWTSHSGDEEREARQLLKACAEDDEAALNTFHDAYYNVVCQTVEKIIHQHRGDPAVERLVAEDVRHIVALVCGRFFQQWEKIEIGAPRYGVLILEDTLKKFTLGVTCRCIWGPPYPSEPAGPPAPDIGQPLVELLGKYYKKFWTRAVMILIGHWRVPEDIAEDAVEHVFWSLVRQAREGRQIAILQAPEKEFLSYIVKGAMNFVRDQAAGLNKFLHEDISLLDTLREAVNIEASAEQKSQEARLVELIHHLKSPYREIMDLILQKDLRLADIARKLDRSPGSIYTQFQRAIEIIRYEFETKKEK